MSITMKRAGDILTLAATVLLSAGLVADVTGKLADVPRLWTAGGLLLGAGLIAGAAAWIFQLSGSRGGRTAFTSALLLILVARWLRGTAAVSPDPPLLAAECIGVLLAWLAVRRRRRDILAAARKRELRSP